jgi:hypothetical protein
MGLTGMKYGFLACFAVNRRFSVKQSVTALDFEPKLDNF